jgi:hypothetical protein
VDLGGGRGDADEVGFERGRRHRCAVTQILEVDETLKRDGEKVQSRTQTWGFRGLRTRIQGMASRVRGSESVGEVDLMKLTKFKGIYPFEGCLRLTPTKYQYPKK